MDTLSMPDRPSNPGSAPVQILATLLFDSRAQTFALGGPLLSGVRGIGSMARKLLYQAGEYYIDLSFDAVEPEQVINITGQVVPSRQGISPMADASITLRQGESMTFHTHADEFGIFMFDRVPRGTYDVNISSRSREIEILNLSVD